MWEGTDEQMGYGAKWHAIELILNIKYIYSGSAWLYSLIYMVL